MLAKAVAVACAPLGVKADKITPTEKGIEIPQAGMAVTLALSSGQRVWRAVAKYQIHPVNEGDVSEAEIVLFAESFENIWGVAKKVAMHLAETRIDAAIDRAA